MLGRIREIVDGARWRARRTTDVGLALAPDELVAVSVGRGLRGPSPDRVLRRPLEAGPEPGGWPALASALTELEERLGAGEDARLRAHVALLPPLGRAKVVRLPAARREALRRLATREVDRHFLPAPREPVADAVALERKRDGPVRALAICAERPIVDAVLAALREAGFEAGLVTHAAWSALEGARVLSPRRLRGDVTLELRGATWRQDLTVEEGELASVSAAPAEVDGDAAAGGAGSPRHGGRNAPDRLRIDAEGDVLHGLGPGAAAAFGTLVMAEDGPLLLQGAARDSWRRRGRVRAGLLAAAAVALLAVAGLVHLRGLDRELDAVARARAAISEPVSQASTARDAAENMAELLGSLRSLRPSGPSWAEVVAELARTLPSSAYLDRLSATGRGIVLAGSARSPSSLVPRLEDSPLLEGVSLESVSRGDGRGPDAFQIAFRLARGPAPAEGDAAPVPGARPDGTPRDTSGEAGGSLPTGDGTADSSAAAAGEGRPGTGVGATAGGADSAAAPETTPAPDGAPEGPTDGGAGDRP